MKKLFALYLVVLFISGCASGVLKDNSSGTGGKAQSPKKGTLPVMKAERESRSDNTEAGYLKVSFDDFPNGKIGADLEGQKIVIDVSFIGVAPSFRGGSYSNGEYLSFLIGRPIPKYFAANPMRGPVGHVFAVVKNNKASEIFSLRLEENFTLFGKVVFLGEQGEGEYGIETINLKK